MTVRALQRVADKLPGVALRIMEDSFAETNRVTELILWNFVISWRAKRQLGIFSGVARDRLVRLRDRGFDFFRRVRVGQCGTDEPGEAQEYNACHPCSQVWSMLAHGFEPWGSAAATAATGKLA